MNIRVLKAESPQIEMAYALYYFGFATYAYCNKWSLQFAYWIAISIVFICFSFLSAPQEEIGFFGKLLALIVMVVCLIWPAHLCLDISNLVKKRKLELYSKMAKQN